VSKRQIGGIDRSAEVLVIEPDEHAVSVYRRDDAVSLASLGRPVDHAAIDVGLFGSDHSSAHSFELVPIEAHRNTTQLKLLDSDQSREVSGQGYFRPVLLLERHRRRLESRLGLIKAVALPNGGREC
jgi:hypothetical protein